MSRAITRSAAGIPDVRMLRRAQCHSFLKLSPQSNAQGMWTRQNCHTELLAIVFVSSHLAC